jgi:plastocyanin
MDLWTQFLDLLSQVLTPAWNDLLQYMPLLLLGLTGLLFLALMRSWRSNGALNRSRVPRPLTSGPPPAGIHLPGPSVWPFVLPIGGMLVLFSLAVPAAGFPVNPVFLVLGAGIAVVGILGWYRDAGREWHRAEAGSHSAELAPVTPLPRLAPRQPPPGIHLPGPSAWPFFAPIALFFVVAGLVFGPFLIAGGLLMGVIAAGGWYLDAGHEYRQVEEGHPPEPRTRDPERAFPKRLIPLFAAVGGLVIVITLLPWLLSYLPSTAASSSAAPEQTPTTTPEISASSAVSFGTNELVFSANQTITLTFDNKQAGVPHNVGIYDAKGGTELFAGDHVTGPATATYTIQPLAPGTYYFQCDIHPNMNGTLIVK